MPEEVSTAIETPQTTETKPKNRPKVILVVVLGFGLLAGAVYVGYWYGTESAKLKVQGSGLPSVTQPQEKPTTEPAVTPVTDSVAGWETYANEKYGFEFRYPPAFELEEKESQYRSDEPKGCQAVFTVSLTNPTFPKRLYVCCPTQEEIEKYGSIPSINIRVRMPDCSASQISCPQAGVLLTRLEGYGVDYTDALSTLTLLCSSGFYDEKGKLNWVDSCEENTLTKTSGVYVIRSSGCSGGSPFEFAQATFIQRENYLYQMKDTASEYEKDGSFDQILSTFKFL